jgi:DNA-binding PadR family transcriptional regulator
MSIRYAILALLEGRDLHGYRLKAVFDERLGPFWTLNFGQIYQALKELKRRSLISGRFDAGTSHMGRWTYTITGKGRRALDTWLRRAPRQPAFLRDEIFVRLLVLERGGPDAALEQLARQECTYADHLARVREHRRSLDPVTTPARLLNALIADADTFHAEARLRWLRHCVTELRAHRAHRPRNPRAAATRTASIAT